MSKKKKKRAGRRKSESPANISEKTQASAKSDGQKRKLDFKESQTGFQKILPILIPLVAAFLVAGIFLLKLKTPSLNLKGSSSLNILLITLDTTRADHLGCYGYKGAKTPNLDRLASEGLRFANAYCPAPLTLPSHTSIFTGLEPVSHGVRNNGHYLSPGISTVTEILKAYGYKTAAFVSSFSVDSRFGLERGFEVYDDTFQAQLPFKTMNAERRAEDTFIKFAKWLENNWKNKFFCWVHYYDPHLPYDPPSPFKEDFKDRPYDGEIAYMDVYVGKIIESLKEKNILDRTIIIVAGDHGEGLGDKVEMGHGIFLYEETIRVPLIFWGKKVFPRPAVVNKRVRLIDLAPTILELAGVEDEAIKMQGKSLVPVFRGKERKDREVLVETFYPKENFGWSELVGLLAGKWKFIQAPRPELYDLKTDPEERKNLYDYSKEIAEELKKKLENLLLSIGSSPAQISAASRAEDLEKLRSLGYLNFAPTRPGSTYPDPKEKIDLLRLIQLAQTYEFEEKYAEAEKVYLKILEEIPDSPASYVNLALAQARQKKLEAAIETLKKGLDRLPDSEILTVRLGHTYLVSGRVREAFETMNKVLEINPKNVDALTVCGGILDAAGRKEEARTYYEKALAIEPESKHLRMSLAANLASTGKLKEAIEIYKKLIDDFPEDQSLYQFTGLAYAYLGDYDQAIFYLRQAVAILPTYSGYFNLAVAYEKSGRIKEAIEYFKLYLQNPKGDSEANVRLARRELERLEKMLAGN